MKAVRTLERAVIQKLSGGRPSRLRASVSAAVAAGVVGASVYRGVRS